MFSSDFRHNMINKLIVTTRQFVVRHCFISHKLASSATHTRLTNQVASELWQCGQLLSQTTFSAQVAITSLANWSRNQVLRGWCTFTTGSTDCLTKPSRRCVTVLLFAQGKMNDYLFIIIKLIKMLKGENNFIADFRSVSNRMQ